MTVDIYLIGENHLHDADNRKKFQLICGQKKVLYAAEHVRLCATYKHYLFDIGDYISNLYSAVALISLYQHNNIASDQNDIDFLELYAEYATTIDSEMELFLKKRYGDDFSLLLLQKLVEKATHQFSTTTIDLLFKFLRKFINQCSLIVDKNIAALNFSLFRQQTTAQQRQNIKKQLIHDLRNPFFMADIEELIQVAHINSRPQLFVILGRAHLPAIGKQLAAKADLLNIKVHIFFGYPIVNQYNSHTGRFDLERQAPERRLEKAAQTPAEILQKGPL